MDDYTSATIIIDKTDPELKVDNTDMKDWTNGDVTFTGSFSDNLSGVEKVQYRHVYNDNTKEDWQDVDFNTEDDGLSGEFSFTLSAQDFNGYIEIYCEDRAANKDYGKDESKIQKFEVKMDITAPELEVTISEPVRFWTNILEAITFGYYNDSDDNNLEITLKASEPQQEEKYGTPSGINYFECYYEDAVSGETTMLIDKNSDENSKFESGSNSAEIKFKVDAPLNADLKFVVYDNAENSNLKDRADNSFADEDTTEQYIVDNISPERTVTYSSPVRTVSSTTMEDIEFDENTENTDTILYYDGDATLTFDITEVNFYPEDAVITVTKDGQAYTEFSLTEWSSKDNDINESKMTLGDEGTYVVKMSYQDRSTNEMDDYTSATIIIDKTNPVISVNYSNKNIKNTIDGRDYFDTPQTATITITEKNFRADDVKAMVTAVNSSGNKVNVTDYAAYLSDRNNWTTDGDVHTATIEYSADANYTFDISYSDLADRSSKDYAEDKFTVDKTAPTDITISYSKSLLEQVIGAVTFGYYKEQVKVDIIGYDETSGIYSFDYEGLLASGVSNTNTAVAKTAIENADITTEGGTSTATFYIPQSALSGINQFNGTLTVSAYDRSSNSTQNADTKRLVADNIAPVGTMTFNEASGEANGLSYYSGDITASIEIIEANFYPEDVDFKVNNSAISLNWNSNGDIHTAEYTVSNEDEYQFSLNYTDRSGNEMTEITRSNMVIDKTAPTITVDSSLKNQTANNGETIKLKITVDDEYFDADCINAELWRIVSDTASDSPELKASQLVTEKVELTPVQSGTSYVYTINNVDKDGFYTLNCLASDYAGNKNSDMHCTDSNDKSVSIETFNFSVNREGSTFWVDSSVENDTYTNSNEISVEIHEINVDKVSEDTKLRIINDNDTENVTLDENNCSQNESIKDGGWYENVYTLNNDYFAKDSAYTVTVTSRDEAENVNISSDSDLSVISFIVDRTAPIVSSNINSNQSINASDFNVEFKITESNLNEDSIVVKVNGEQQEFSKLEGSNSYTFNMNNGMYQNVEITVNDLAGNQLDEPYFIENVTISTNIFVLWFANKLLFWLTIAGVVVIAAGIIFFIVFKKRKKNEE